MRGAIACAFQAMISESLSMLKNLIKCSRAKLKSKTIGFVESLQKQKITGNADIPCDFAKYLL
jgi:hypothetical protein